MIEMNDKKKYTYDDDNYEMVVGGKKKQHRTLEIEEDSSESNIVSSVLWLNKKTQRTAN